MSKIKQIIDPAAGAAISEVIAVFDYPVTIVGYDLQSAETMDIEGQFGPGANDYSKVAEISEAELAIRINGPGYFRVRKTDSNVLSGAAVSGKVV